MDPDVIESSQPEGLRCPNCEKTYKSKSGLSKHSKTCKSQTPLPIIKISPAATSSNNNDNALPSATLKCKQCERSFATKSGLAKHVKTCAESSRRKCRYCEASFNTYAGLRTHESRTHKDEETARAGEEVPKTS